MTLKQVRTQLKTLGIEIKKTEDSEYRVALIPTDTESSAYYTDDLMDALRTGQSMAENRRISTVTTHNRYAQEIMESAMRELFENEHTFKGDFFATDTEMDAIRTHPLEYFALLAGMDAFKLCGAFMDAINARRRMAEFPEDFATEEK